MKDNYFNGKYAKYWKERTENFSNEAKIPSEDQTLFFIGKMGISKKDNILDLGCGHGRLYPTLSHFSDRVIGIDIGDEAIKEAEKYPYKKVVKGSAEKTNLEDDYFEKIIAWAVYDAVDQEDALMEENRILKKDGLLLITGKNRDYDLEDIEAFIAERNAKLKNFPNHFTDVYKLIQKRKLFGFDVVEAYGFPRRGDFGSLRYFDILSAAKRTFYEFVIIFKKVGKPNLENNKICQEYSDTAIVMSRKNGFDDVEDFFKWHRKISWLDRV